MTSIRNISHQAEFYDRLPFILIGDSGQKVPEIYTEISKNFPNRVKAIYIRYLHSDKRKNELKNMADDSAVPFLIMKNSDDALKHAIKKLQI